MLFPNIVSTGEVYFIMNKKSESQRQDSYMRIGVMKDSKTKDEESTRLVYIRE
jgi:hypothetical protein